MSGGIPQLTGGRLLRRSVSSAPPLCAPLGFLGIHFFCALGPQRAHSFPLLLLFPPLFGATSEDERVEHLLQRISDLLNKYPDPAANPEQVPATVTQLTRRSRKSCELKSHQRYSQTFRYLLMTFLRPHLGLLTGPDDAGVTTRQEAWKWVYYDVREDLGRPDWRHAGNFSGVDA